MPRFYSAKTGGFHTVQIVRPGQEDAKVPESYVPVTDELHASLMAAQAAGKTITADANGNPIAIDYVPQKADINGAILKQLADIDAKKTRAFSDFILTGDKTMIASLEDEAVKLRAQLIK